MRVYYIDLVKISHNLIVLALLASTALLFSMIVRQNIPSTASATSKIISKVQTKQKVVALTFNVNAGMEVIPVIQALEEQKSRATFFIDPDWAKENHDVLRQLSLKGHEIGILVDTQVTGNPKLSEQMTKSKELFAQLTGSSPWLVRFAKPEPESEDPDTMYSLGYQIIGSSGTLLDIDGKNKDWLQPGNILCISLEGKNDYTKELITNTVLTLKEQRYDQATLSELLAYGPGITE